MAQPIRFSVPAPDPRAVLRDRLDRAPEEHAQAILAAYELLQALHDRGILDVTTSALRASDALLEKVKSNMQEVRARGGELYVFTDLDSRFTASEGVEPARDARPRPGWILSE